MTVDWQQLAQALGTITEHDSGRQEDGGTAAARLALASILGPAVWRDAVDHYVAGRPGAELSRSVLRMVRPAAAVERCLELLNDKTGAVEARRVRWFRRRRVPVETAYHRKQSGVVSYRPLSRLPISTTTLA